MWSDHIDAPSSLQAEATEAARQEAERALLDSGLEGAEATVSFGDPVDEIVRAVTEEHADLVVVGSSEAGLLKRLFSGSVPHKLVDKLTVPVVIVP